MNGGHMHVCGDCDGVFEVKIGTHPNYCPHCGHDTVIRT